MDIEDVAETTGGVEDIPPFRASSADEVSTTPRKKYSVEEDGDDIYSQANAGRPGFTKNDQKDMYRMGKTQEFRVRPLTWHLGLQKLKKFFFQARERQRIAS
jgi:hypothetical protein